MAMQNTVREKADQRVIIFLRFFLIRWLTKEPWNRWRESILEETRIVHVIRFDVVSRGNNIFQFLTNLKFREY